MNRDGELPGEDEQFEAYRTAVEAMQGRPVTIRTVDIGADKALDRMSANELRHEHALNPALGLRAIRWSLSEPAMFRQQLRAILRAAVPRQGADPDPDGRAPQRGAAHARRARAGAPAARRRRPRLRAGRDRRDGRGAGGGADAAVVPAPLRLRLDRHQRPHPVHLGDRPCRRGGRASVQRRGIPAVLQLVAQTIAQRQPAAQGRQRVRRDGGRPSRSPSCLLGDGLAQLLDAPVADRRRQGARARDRCAAMGRRARRACSAADDPERECAAIVPRASSSCTPCLHTPGRRCRITALSADATAGRRPKRPVDSSRKGPTGLTGCLRNVPESLSSLIELQGSSSSRPQGPAL